MYPKFSIHIYFLKASLTRSFFKGCTSSPASADTQQISPQDGGFREVIVPDHEPGDQAEYLNRYPDYAPSMFDYQYQGLFK